MDLWPFDFVFGWWGGEDKNGLYRCLGFFCFVIFSWYVIWGGSKEQRSPKNIQQVWGLGRFVDVDAFCLEELSKTSISDMWSKNL